MSGQSKVISHDAFLVQSEEVVVNGFQKGKFYTIHQNGHNKSFRGKLMYNAHTKQHVLSGWELPDKTPCHIPLVQIELSGWSLLQIWTIN